MDGEDESWRGNWFVTLLELNALEIPRCLFPEKSNITSIELHTFFDASEEAFAALVYVRTLYSDGNILIRQIKATIKFAPKKTISFPKLELNVALLGSRLTKAVQTTLDTKVLRRWLWTDSSTVRNWIRGTAAYYQVFVSKTVGRFNPSRSRKSGVSFSEKSILQYRYPFQLKWRTYPVSLV